MHAQTDRQTPPCETSVSSPRVLGTIDAPAGPALLLPYRVFCREKISLRDVADDLYAMARLRPSRRPVGIVMTTLCGNHTSPREAADGLTKLLQADAVLPFGFLLHDQHVPGSTVGERYAALAEQYPFHLRDSPRFVIVADVAGNLSLSDTPGIASHYIPGPGEYVPFKTRNARFFAYNSYSSDRAAPRGHLKPSSNA